uniref:Uncharacterized protein n=1 Tax=Anguilla anguilla TaxID=7936 RepID=A0A0E9QDC0_ANGAN
MNVLHLNTQICPACWTLRNRLNRNLLQ